MIESLMKIKIIQSVLCVYDKIKYFLSQNCENNFYFFTLGFVYNKNWDDENTCWTYGVCWGGLFQLKCCTSVSYLIHVNSL